MFKQSVEVGIQLENWKLISITKDWKQREFAKIYYKRLDNC